MRDRKGRIRHDVRLTVVAARGDSVVAFKKHDVRLQCLWVACSLTPLFHYLQIQMLAGSISFYSIRYAVLRLSHRLCASELSVLCVRIAPLTRHTFSELLKNCTFPLLFPSSAWHLPSLSCFLHGDRNLRQLRSPVALFF